MIFLTAATLSSTLSGQTTISFSGIVTSSGNGMPVPGHPVHILLNDHIHHNIIFTGPDGTFADSIFLMGWTPDSVIIATRDCVFEWHEQVFTNINEPLYASFMICADTLPAPCQSSFSWEASGNDPLEVFFTDLSTGNIMQWTWDFGDGTISHSQNPVHTYTQAGEYMVCLGIGSFDSLFPCFDVYCEMVVAGDSSTPCTADFVFHLDSASGNPNRFIFTSTSGGNPDHWQWDFGDGSTGTGPQVAHQYENEGTYDVCLTVTGNQNPSGCYDNICKTVGTPAYTFFGGQVYAGNFPINNPVHTGDTGMVYLYRLYDDDLVAVDTNYFFNELGLYAFNMVLPGDYIIKALLTENSTNFSRFFPTYYPQNIHWQNSGTLNLAGPVQNADIHLFPCPQDLPHGPGVINGTLSFSTDAAATPDPSNIVVLLLDKAMNPLEFTLTDALGHFSFSGIATGTYLVKAEEAGWNSAVEEVRVTHSNPVVNVGTMLLEVFSAFGVDDPTGPELFEGPWPNPVSTILHLRLSDRLSGKISVVINDLAGRTVYRQEVPASGSREVLSVPVHSLDKGLYIIRVSLPGEGASQVKKFIR